MKRREKPRDVVDRPEAPLWIRQLNFAMHHFRKPGEPAVLGGPWVQRWRRAQDDWCREKGCYRVGKPCAEIYRNVRSERPCEAGEMRN
ncbi:hypothetical protein AB0C29_12265 [Actinoplanes sp. NPDC048791]|uniref:hypothetical protein n=1 Tax=Actinoplanes sp. NPDC048791 TaxID=3154623 RepID=UPI0033CC7C2A